MKLTGKCKELFEAWYKEQPYEMQDLHGVNHDIATLGFYDLDSSFQWGALQDFADSLGYYIDVETNYVIQTKHFRGYRAFINGLPASEKNIEDRQEAHNAAIEKFNQLINKT